MRTYWSNAGLRVTFGQVLGMFPAEAVRWVRVREGQRAMPDELTTEAWQAR
ncbi:hypothetical protein OPAG_08112 [Rhodococcus opacus PD630]|uniref:hypothetical protein n=1 Tax=Rhodococcus opacus TaxID=37919 RepID=UPI00029CB900|nr:hypothetical protein [Rhodococcus opacus]AHK35308.1 hypothetical protein Pd630_LPD09068 [Rhodococcus opacus PD630]EHI41292.1 hypothetical protein OPAG_08112 [Rhodococcus opacus PD630]UDH01619.1 hypothetical protein K2Z90_008194 [Rhodococcus opacus PD630]